MMKKTVIILLGLSWCASELRAQTTTLSTKLKAINLAYFNLNQCMTVSATMKAGDVVKKVEYKAYMKNMSEYYMISDDTELLIRNSVKVALNKNVKSVMIDSISSMTRDDFPVQMFDTLVTKYSSVKYERRSGGLERYTLVPGYGEVKKIIIDFDSSTHLIKSLYVENLGANSTLTTMNVAYSYSPLKQGAIPPITKYLSFDNNGVAILQHPYKSYQLINFLNR